MRGFLALIFAIAMVMAAARTAQADRRVALVIGNSAYQHTQTLRNPKNDAADISAALKSFGFEVIGGLDLDKSGMDRTLREFARALVGSDVGVLFYAGHGLQVANQNYLVPVDARLEDTSGLDFELVRLDVVQRTMEREARTNILFLDACRDNPLARNLSRAMGTRSTAIGRGLAQVEAGGGTLISYSTQPGNVALDGAGRNSPFASALVKHLATPGADLGTTLIRVRRDVMQETQSRQVPWEHSALTDAFYFQAGSATTSSTATLPAQSEAAQAWSVAERSNDAAVLEAFIKHYGDTFYGALGRSRLEELKKSRQEEPKQQKIANLEPVKPPAPFTMFRAITLRLQDTYPTKDTSAGDPLREMARDVETMSSGKLKLEILPAGAVIPAFQGLDAVSTGVLDAAWTTPTYWYGVHRAFGIFSGMVPLGLDATAFVRWLEAEGGVELNRLVREVAKKNARSLPCAVLGPGGDWYKKQIRQMSDFRGMKFRTVGLLIEIGTKFGLAVNALPGGEIVAAMDRGLLDASDWSTPASAVILGLPDVSKQLHYPGWTRPVHLLELIVGDHAWSKLDAGARQGLETACRQNLRRSLARIPELEQRGLAEARSNGVTVQPYPPAVLDAIKAATQRTLDDLAKNDADFARVLASYNKYR